MMTEDSSNTRLSPGVKFAVLAAALFGSTTPVAKILLGDIHPVLLAGILYFGSGVGLSATRLLTRSSAEEAGLGRTELPWLGGAILFGGILAPVLLLFGLRLASASAASLLLNLEGVFTAGLAWIVFRENVDRRIAIGMGFIVLGGVLLTCQNGFGLEMSLGALLIIGACFCWGIDNNLTQKVSNSDPYQVAAIKGLCAGCFNLVASWLLGVPGCPLMKAAAGLLVGYLGYGLSLVLFVLGLRYIGTSRTGAYFSLAPFWGAGLSMVLFGERPTPILIAAAASMGAGLWLHLTESHEHPHEHEELDHDHSHTHDDHHAHEHEAPCDPSVEHAHPHRHARLVHFHAHFPDIHHRHH